MSMTYSSRLLISKIWIKNLMMIISLTTHVSLSDVEIARIWLVLARAGWRTRHSGLEPLTTEGLLETSKKSFYLDYILSLLKKFTWFYNTGTWQKNSTFYLEKNYGSGISTPFSPSASRPLNPSLVLAKFKTKLFLIVNYLKIATPEHWAATTNPYCCP